ncbi:hypothetical protein P175DRAFT_0469158 [Aspergillus ochraceoroseus IBT 24754]|uniref:AB hydrolase-1 domain-containing protein n=2 Tax=Aspergillus ochraceoroseus TaxID=138278 RepID=A0A2T5MAX8_9EURO|nr:uncharacterized protein P175DRAFT_0469158 [Aspergillus ochraceoroseus IBT 24754]KKK24834.1 hypothetical protein AOCH_005786 [Aspergillus ochraceoroseus]PTU25665.1 hypothetical protein P175DRAFT_0469158 [Aspergillus ochraceoroseus IBT 24754]
MSNQSCSPHDFALTYISNARFHCRFTLPATSSRESLTVSYADVGVVPNPTNPTPPTILFMPGMFGSRFLGVFMHTVAEKLGVRVLVVDRPGMGHSTDVPLSQRVAVWLELVPQILTHLGIEHVALVSHSAGMMYLLNTLFYCRNILHPERPFVAFLAPWVDPSNSHVTQMQMAQYIPTAAFSLWNRVPKFFLLKAGPVFASSGVVASTVSTAVSSSTGHGDGQENSELEKNRQRIERDYGISRDVQAELDNLVFKSMFAENTIGANSEALQCLRKGPGGAASWGKAQDYRTFVKEFVDRERKGRSEGLSLGARLRIRAYFGETDSMIGKLGQTYVEECWQGTENGAGFEDVLDFDTRTIPGTDHNSLVQSVVALESVMIHAGGLHGTLTGP